MLSWRQVTDFNNHIGSASTHAALFVFELECVKRKSFRMQLRIMSSFMRIALFKLYAKGVKEPS